MSGRAAGAPGVVVVNYEAGPALAACVASLRAAGVAEVVVVDNGSRDGSLAALAAADRSARLLPLGRNAGYGSAANAGVRRLGELHPELELVLVCNPDLVVDPGAPAALVQALVTHPESAVAGPCLVSPAGERYSSARAFPSYTTALAHAALGMFSPTNRWSRRYRMEDGAGSALGGASAEQGAAVDWVSGACFLVRRIAFESVGGFDEAYFMYVEDLDLCWRLRRAGWEVRYVPAARVVHEQGRSASRRPYRMLVAHHRSAWRFARRRASGAGRLALPVIAAGAGLRLAAAVLQQATRRGRGGGRVE